MSSPGGSRRKFKFIKEIAEGGFGKVYLAEQVTGDGFSRIVAIKLLHAQWSTNDEIVMRTRDEARLLGLIRHQHIVKVEDLTSIDGKCAIVMEYLEGVDLKVMINHLRQSSGRFPLSAVADIMIAATSALDAAYNGRPLQGGNPLQVIHRDIKPSNIFVTTTGGVKVLDFGTARANFAEREAKTQALAFGSTGYMAPERMMGEPDTPAGDIFSLGISLYELLSLESFGKLPARKDKFEKKVEERVGQIPLVGDATLQEKVRGVVRRMMSYEPTDRPKATELIESFEYVLEHAGDDSLRKFCRTAVADAKAALPELSTADPLLNKEIDEDISSALPLDHGAQPPGAPTTHGTEPVPAAPPKSATKTGATPAPVPTRTAVRTATPAPVPRVASAPEPAPGRSPLATAAFVVVGGVVIVVLFVLVTLLGVFIGLMAFQ